MRVGIDITPITTTRTGVGNYCYYLLRELLEAGPDVAFAGFSSGSGRTDLGGLPRAIAHKHLPVPTRVLYQLWNHLRVPRVDAFLGGVDVYHATNFFLPPVRSARRVLTIHDLTFLVAPQFSSPAIVGPFSRGIRRFAHEADAILVYSDSTKRDVVERLGVDETKIAVAPIAADPALEPVPRETAAARLRERFGLREPYFLFVGTLEPRKNVATLVRAFALLEAALPHRLALVGPEGWNAAAAFDAIRASGAGDRILHPGFVSNEDLAAFYSAADALVFPSWYEGFGLPVLEAMTCGCPVIASNNSSLPEAGGDAALYVPCDDAEAIASAMRRVAEDSGLREAMVKKGIEQARKFSWRDCARATLEVYRRLAG